MTDQPTTYHSYKDLQVWQKSLEFASQVIKSLGELKAADKQLIGEPLFSTAIAVPAHIANGFASKSKAVYVDSLKSALGQTAVIETIMESCTLAGISLSLSAEDLKFIRIMLAKLTSSLTSKNKEPKIQEKEEKKE